MKSAKLWTVALATLSCGLVLSLNTSVTAMAKTTSSKTTTTVHKGHYRIAKYAGFASKTYRTGYLIDPERNYSFYTFDQSTGRSGSHVAFKIKNGLIPLKVKKNGKNSAGVHVYDVLYKQLHASEEYWTHYSTVQPYNVTKLDNQTVTSETTPFSGKAVLPHGTKAKQIKIWMTDKSGNRSVFYKHVKGGWKYSGIM